MYAFVKYIMLQRAASAETYNNKQQPSKKKHYTDKKEIDMSIVGEPAVNKQITNKSIR